MGLFGYSVVKEHELMKDMFESKPEVDNYSLFDTDVLRSIGISKDENRKLWDVITALRQQTLKRKDRYAEYKKAIKDPIIGQAIEMMADDATQFDVDREKTVWVESSDKEYAEAINGIINDYIEPFVDTLASGIVARGEFAFKVADEEGEDRGEYKDVVLIPYKRMEQLHHLILPDQDHVYFECLDISSLPQQGSGEEIMFEDFENFLHFINYSIENSEEVKLQITKKGKKKTAEREEVSVFVLQGESIITDKVLETFRILTTIENAIVQYRLAKSKLVRFVNVDVTRLTDDKKAQAIVNYVHGSIAANESISKDSFETTTVHPEPIVVTVPVKNGVGAITVQEFASDVNVRDIADVDHFMNKMFAGLRTPKAYFNFEENVPGFSASGAALTRIDIRYARAVKKVQRVIVNGIKDLIVIFNKKNGITKDEAPEVKVRIVKVASAEETDRLEELATRLNMATTVVSALIDPTTGEANMGVISAYEKFFTHVIPNPEMISFIKSLTTGADIVSKPDGIELKGVLKQI